MLTHGILTPHSPALVPAVGGEKVKKFEKTVNALLAVSLRLKETPPDTFVVLTPHGDLQPASFTIRVPREPDFRADFSEFGGGGSVASYPRDRLLTAQIIEGLQSAGLPTKIIDDPQLDFGTVVPLVYLAAVLPEVAIVSLGISLAGAPEHARLGEVIRAAADKTTQKIVFLVSGELSHRLIKASPYGFHPAAAEWDARIVRELQNGEYEKLLHIDPFERDEVAECGFRGIAALVGAFAGQPHTHEILSYEAPAGIGLAVGIWERE